MNATHHTQAFAAPHAAALPARPGAGSGTIAQGRDALRRLEGRQVLVVEDEALVAMELEVSFEDAGLGVIGPAYNLSEGMRMAALEGIDAAVLDVNLAGQDVFPVAHLLRERGIPFLFHTGHGTREQLGSRFPDAPVLTKPALVEELAIQLDRLLG